jgi:hypothetical protein
LHRDSPNTVRDLVNDWTRVSRADLGLHTKLQLLEMLDTDLYSQYQPFPEKPRFMERLFDWIMGASTSDDRQTLFEYALALLFVGKEDLESLCRAAFEGPILRWIIDVADINIAFPDAGERLQQARKETFFGSIAGMNIGDFCRYNAIHQEIRPDFREHALIGDPKSLRMYLETAGFVRVVAVEDYVGTGSQMKKAHKYLKQLSDLDLPVLLCPLIVAQEGVKAGEKLAKGNMAFQPVFRIPDAAMIGENESVDEPVLVSKLRDLLPRLFDAVNGTVLERQLKDHIGPFGFLNKGTSLLSYLNCPNNVPPIVHHQSDTWTTPLFRRSEREG